MNYCIGIDIGTTSTKAVAFSNDGEVIAKEEIAYPIIHPVPGYSEQNPEEIFNAVLNCISSITKARQADEPILVSFSAAMHSFMLIDENGHPLTNTIIWADNRAGEIAAQLRELQAGDTFYHKTGVPVHAMSPLCKIIWFRENEPAVFSKANKFIGVKEYIFFRLFGKYLVDTSIASATGLLNIHTLQWDAAIVNYAGIRSSQLSEVVSAQHKEYLPEGSDAYNDTRLQAVKKAAFIAGSSDGALANLGSGAVGRNAMAVSIGTSSAVRLVSNEVYTDEYMRTFCYHIANHDYIIGGASNNGAVILQWFKDMVLETKASYEQLFEEAAAVPAGSNGLIFIPYVLGERAPVWNSDASGVFFGLTISHTKAHCIRAVMEGIVYNMYSIGKVLMEKRKVTEIHATGGFTRSPLWIQLLCDMFNCTVFVSGAVESSAYGAVKLGMDAMGIASGNTPKTTDRYEPNALQHQAYQQQFEKMERLYGLLKNEMRSTNSTATAAVNK